MSTSLNPPTAVLEPAAARVLPDEITVRVSKFPRSALDRLRAHAAAEGHKSDAGALRWAALRWLKACDAVNAAPPSEL